MRILHLTDTHLGRRLRVRGAPPGWSRADDHHDALVQALVLASELEVDAVVHTGDVFDRSRPPARDVERACAVLREAARERPVVLLPGNHDRRGLARHVGDVVQRVEPSGCVQIGDVRLVGVGYQREATTWAGLAKRAWGGGGDVLFTHMAFDGVRVPGHTFQVGVQPDTLGPEHLPSGVRHVMCGHIHPPQIVQVGSARVVHPGATERTSFTESRRPVGVCLWSFERTVDVRWIPLQVRAMRTVHRRADLRGLRPGTLVSMGSAATPDLESEVLRSGGWVSGPPVGTPRARRARRRPSTQLGLFVGEPRRPAW